MVKKAEAMPGAKLVFTRNPARSINGYRSEDVPFIAGYGSAGSVFDGVTVRFEPGDEATVVLAPKKYEGIQTIVLRDSDGREGHVYWTDVYHNATLKENTNA